MSAVILHIGPITLPDGQKGDSLYFLHPADPERPPVLAPDLAEALHALNLDGEMPVCEPALAAEARDLGLAVSDLTEAARTDLALMALDLAGSDFVAIAADELVSQFCAAMAGFVARANRVGPDAPRILDVALQDGQRLSALLIGGPGLVLSPSPDRATVEGTAAICSDAAPEIIDALSRSHGLTCLPGCFRLGEGEKRRVTNGELAILAAALNAIARLAPDGGATAVGQVRANGDDVALTVAAP